MNYVDKPSQSCLVVPPRWLTPRIQMVIWRRYSLHCNFDPPLSLGDIYTDGKAQQAHIERAVWEAINYILHYLYAVLVGIHINAGSSIRNLRQSLNNVTLFNMKLSWFYYQWIARQVSLYQVFIFSLLSVLITSEKYVPVRPDDHIWWHKLTDTQRIYFLIISPKQEPLRFSS